MGISNHECSNVYIGTGKSRPDMDEHRLLHNCFMPNMYKDEYLKKSNSRYDYMHIRVLSGFVSTIFDIFGQHWKKLHTNKEYFCHNYDHCV